MIISGFFEALGVAAFLPLFQIIVDGEAQRELLPASILSILDQLGIEINLATLSVFIALTISFKGAILWSAMRYVSSSVAYIANELRLSLFSALINANWRHFTNQPLGKNLNAIITETFGASSTFVSLTKLIASAVQFTVYAISAVVISWQTSIFAVIGGTILLLTMSSLVKISRRSGYRMTELAKSMLTVMAEMIQSTKALKTMGLEDKFHSTLTEQTESLKIAQTNQLRSNQALNVFHEPLMVIVTLLWINMTLFFDLLSITELMVMGVIFIRILTSLNGVQGQYQRMVSQENALWSFMNTLDTTAAARENWTGHNSVPNDFSTIEFKNVSFGYDDKEIYRDLNIKFTNNTFYTIFGESGSGKSTAIDLISGLLKPEKGQILINQEDLSTLSIHDWRKHIGFVPQEMFLFNDTIYENIVVGRRDLTEEDVWSALKLAGVDDFVKKQPHQLNQPVGENGRLLSGGQKQRIAIARAIIHKPKVLLLDEATSALDEETETVLLETLRDLSKKMIVIFVSHNQNIKEYADHNYDLKGHKLVKV